MRHNSTPKHREPQFKHQKRVVVFAMMPKTSVSN